MGFAGLYYAPTIAAARAAISWSWTLVAPDTATAPASRPPLLARTRLQPDTRHEFPSQHDHPVAAVRLAAFPDGGLSRVRLIGHVTPGARRAAGYRWFNSLPAPQAIQCLTDAGLNADLAAQAVARRPLTEDAAASDPALITILEGQPRRAP